MLDMFLKQPEKPDDSDNPLRVAYTLGGTKETYETFEKRFNMVLLEVYGGTEPNVVSYNSYDKRKLGSCGTVLPDFDVKIFDEDDNELPQGKIGEIVTRYNEPFIMFLGYYNMKEKTLEAFRNLWYHTGDAGYFDEEGYLYFVDRQKDVIRRRMEFISSTDVEEVINSHPSVLESAAIGVPSPEFKNEQEVKVIVVLNKGMQLSPEELISFCEPRMAYFTIPRYLEFKEALPKTPTEKVEKHKLKAEGVTQSTWDREKAGYKLKR
jgi:crotonobetaine/carnitine-CoA ligase